MQPALWLLAVLSSPLARAQPAGPTTRPVLFVVADEGDVLGGVAPTLMACGGRVVAKDDGQPPDVAAGDSSWAGLATGCPSGELEVSIARGSETVWTQTVDVAASLSGPSVRIRMTASGTTAAVQGDGGAEAPSVVPEEAPPLGDEEGALAFEGVQQLPGGTTPEGEPMVLSPEEALALSGHEEGMPPEAEPGEVVPQEADEPPPPDEASTEPGPPAEGSVPGPPEEGSVLVPETPAVGTVEHTRPAPAVVHDSGSSFGLAWGLAGAGLVLVAGLGGLAGFSLGRRRASKVKLDGASAGEGPPGGVSGRWKVPAEAMRAAALALAAAHRGPVLLVPADRELDGFGPQTRWLPQEHPLPEDVSEAARALRPAGPVLVVVEGPGALEPPLPHHDPDAVLDEVPDELGDIAHVLLVSEGDAAVTLELREGRVVLPRG